MMNSSPSVEPAAATTRKSRTGLQRCVIRGDDARISPARLDADLRSNPYVRLDGADPRLVDPSLARAFDELTASVRAAAESAGYASGYTSGYAAAVAVVRLEAELAEAARKAQRVDEGRAINAVLSSLRREIAGLAARQLPLMTDLADLVAPASVLLAGAVLGREIDLTDNPGLDAVRRVLASVPDDGDIVVRLHPVDARLLADSGALEAIDLGRAIRLVSDPALSRGDALADCGDLHVDACLGSALDRAAEVLTP